MFEGLMANLVVPETTWGTRSLGLDDLRWAEVQEKWCSGTSRAIRCPGPLGSISPTKRCRSAKYVNTRKNLSRDGLVELVIPSRADLGPR
jgi:hypothetical protein